MGRRRSFKASEGGTTDAIDKKLYPQISQMPQIKRIKKEDRERTSRVQQARMLAATLKEGEVLCQAEVRKGGVQQARMP